MTRRFPVVFEWAGRNFSAYAPDVLGCMATANSLASIRAAMKGALESHLHWLNEAGDPIPQASREVVVDMSSDREFPQPKGYYVVVERLEINLPRKKRASAAKHQLTDLVAA